MGPLCCLKSPYKCELYQIGHTLWVCLYFFNPHKVPLGKRPKKEKKGFQKKEKSWHGFFNYINQVRQRVQLKSYRKIGKTKTVRLRCYQKRSGHLV
jgi:hypothetical protein